MSLWIKCDRCGKEKMHPSMRKKDANLNYGLADWLMMDVIDICLDCALKCNLLEKKNGRYIWKENYTEEEVAEIIRKNE